MGTILVRHKEGIYKFEREPALIATARSIRVGLLDFPISGWSAHIGIARSYRASPIISGKQRVKSQNKMHRSGWPDRIGPARSDRAGMLISGWNAHIGHLNSIAL